MDAAGREGEGDREADGPPQMADFSIKALKLSGLTVELGSEYVQDLKVNQSLNGMSENLLATTKFIYISSFHKYMYMYILGTLTYTLTHTTHTHTCTQCFSL